MKKSEIFVLITGVIGLIADAIALSLFFSLNISREAGNLTSPSTISKIIIAGVMIYGWFIISWMLIRRAWVKSSITKLESLTKNSRRSELHDRKARYTIMSMGILIIPLQWLFISNLLPFSHPIFHEGDIKADEVLWFVTILMMSMVSLAFIGGLISLAIDLLMPIIYADMEDLHS